jgi:ABC-type lipoprotein release transport system permease subunit
MCFYVPDWVYPPNVSTLVLRLDRDPGKEFAGALALTRFMQSLLFETTPYDPLVYAGLALVLLAAAVLACWIPARRAARVDIARLLRTE